MFMTKEFPRGYKATDYTLLAHAYFSRPGMPDSEQRIFTTSKPVGDDKVHVMAFVSPREKTDALQGWFVLSAEVTKTEMQTLGWRPQVTRSTMVAYLEGAGDEPVEYFRALNNVGCSLTTPPPAAKRTAHPA
jgi:hypothetical protein